MDNKIDGENPLSLKKKLHDLLFVEYVPEKDKFKSMNSYYYKYIRSLLLKYSQIDDSDVLKMVTPLVEATINVNTALQNCFTNKSSENIQALYEAQESLITTLNQTKDSYKNEINDGKKADFIAGVIFIATFIAFFTIMLSLLFLASPEAYLIGMLGVVMPATCVIHAGVGVYMKQHEKQLDIVRCFSYTENAFAARNKKHFELFTEAAKNAGNKEYTKINKDETWFNCFKG